MNHLGISGAGFAIPGIAGASVNLLQQGFKPDIISGVSSGAILAFLYTFAENPIDIIENDIVNFSTKDVFKNEPINNKGKLTFRSIWNLLTKGYLSDNEQLKKTLMKYVSEKTFNSKKNNFETPKCLVLCVDISSGKRIVKNLNDLSYSDAVSTVVASTSIPIITKPLKTDNMILFDGGIRNHILTEYIFDIYDIKNSYSVFSRPSDCFNPKHPDKLKSSISILMRTIEIMQYEISKSDEQLADLKAKEKGINNCNIFLPRVLDNIFENDKSKLKELYDYGKNIVIPRIY